MSRMPKLNKTTVGVAAVLGGVAGAAYLKTKLDQDPNRGPWNPRVDLQTHYDYIVVGADDIPASMTPLLFSTLLHTDMDWNLTTTPQTHVHGRIMSMPRGKLLGGSSSINAMMYHRGPASDYDEWAALGNTEWNYKECLRYFKKAEGFNDPDLPPGHLRGPLTRRIRKTQYEQFEPEFHGTEGPWQVTFHYMFGATEGFIRANAAEGIPLNKDLNGSSTMGVARVQTFIQRNAIRSSAARAYLGREQLKSGEGKRGRIRIVYGAHIARILIQKRRGVKVAIGAEFLDSNHGIIFRATRNTDSLASRARFYHIPKLLYDYKVNGVGPLSSQAGEAASFVRLEDIAPEFVAREKANGTWQDRSSGRHSPHVEILFVPGYMRNHTRIKAPDGKNYYTLTALLLNPVSSGKVAISDIKDGKIETLIDPNYFEDDFDTRVMAEMIRFIRHLGKRMRQDPEVGGVEVFPGTDKVPSDDAVKLHDYIKSTCETFYHPTSTCHMGPRSDPLAVVDERLCVYGIDRLRVVDASVMPKVVAAHTCAPTVMIAEKAADMIKEDWRDAGADTHSSSSVLARL
ncbi:hypothetical protein EDD11_006115 [Mortierella claussenii]|nr:hypothetical protein EDD11_006115 [Mortierella claussenii]